MPGLQIYQIASTFKSAFGTPEMIVGVVSVICIAFVVWGGIKRIGHVAELLAPVMCVVYVIMAVVIIGMNIEELPAVFGSIFSSAFGANQIFAGILGAAISNGVKYSLQGTTQGRYLTGHHLLQRAAAVPPWLRLHRLYRRPDRGAASGTAERCV